MNYNYVYISVAFNPRDVDKDGYYEICIQDLRNLENVQVIDSPVQHTSRLIRNLFMLHNSRKIEKRIKLPLKTLWYPKYIDLKFDETKPLCFVVSNFNYPIGFYRYLKKRYPRAKFVKIHRDLYSLFPQRYPDYTEEFCKTIFDLSLSWDKKEASDLGWLYFDEFESKIDIEYAEDYPLCDVFFAGRAKDRLNKLLHVYDKLTRAGLKCRYYLTGVPQNDRKPLEGIEYADKNISYTEMLYRTVNSRCVLEINQDGAVGYTSRFLEAVMFNKKLLTDNEYVKNSKFYDSMNICCFDDVDSIDSTFIANIANCNDVVDYHYDGEFSPVHLIEQIDAALTEMSKNEV